MNMKAPHHILLAILGLIALVLSGCGGNEDRAKELGCPSGSILANQDDIMVIKSAGPQSWTFYVGANYGSVGNIPINALQYSQAYLYGPIVVQVQGPFNTPRNNICVVMNSDGFFWNKDYTVMQGDAAVGFHRYVTKTDASGEATIWWSTEALFSSASASGGTDGAAASGTDSIAASSGPAVQAYWNATYSVLGCPATLPLGVLCP